MARSSIGVVLALAIPLALALPARANADEAALDANASAAAQEKYSAGRESYRAGLYGRALEEFERSLALVPSPNTRLYLARTLRELGRWSEAADQYRATILEAEARGGRYAATRDAADMELRDVKVRIERGDPTSRTDRTERLHDEPPPLLAPPPAAPSGSGPTTLTWVSGGVAVAGMASFAVFYGLAGGRYGYLEDNCARTRDASCDSARKTGQTEELVAYVSLGVAAAAAAVAVVSLVVRPSSNGAAVAARAMGPWRLAF